MTALPKRNIKCGGKFIFSSCGDGFRNEVVVNIWKICSKFLNFSTIYFTVFGLL